MFCRVFRLDFHRKSLNKSRPRSIFTCFLLKISGVGWCKFCTGSYGVWKMPIYLMSRMLAVAHRTYCCTHTHAGAHVHASDTWAGTAGGCCSLILKAPQSTRFSTQMFLHGFCKLFCSVFCLFAACVCLFVFVWFCYVLIFFPMYLASALCCNYRKGHPPEALKSPGMNAKTSYKKCTRLGSYLLCLGPDFCQYFHTKHSVLETFCIVFASVQGR